MGISGQSGPGGLPKSTGSKKYMVQIPHKSGLNYTVHNMQKSYVERIDTLILEKRNPAHQGHAFFRDENPTLHNTIYSMVYNDLANHQLVYYRVLMRFQNPEPVLQLVCEKFPQEFAPLCHGPFKDPITEREFMIAYMQYLNLV